MTDLRIPDEVLCDQDYPVPGISVARTVESLICILH